MPPYRRRVWAMHVKDVVVKETASYPQLTHPIADRLEIHHTIPHLAEHDKAGSQLVIGSAALVYGRPQCIVLPLLRSLPTHLLQCYNIEVSGFKLVR